MLTDLKQKIEEPFKDSLYIEHVLTKNISCIQENDFDLIITTTHLIDSIPTIPVVLITSFFNMDDKKITGPVFFYG